MYQGLRFTAISHIITVADGSLIVQSLEVGRVELQGHCVKTAAVIRQGRADGRVTLQYPFFFFYRSFAISNSVVLIIV